jgi:signal transduction histidine kinase
LIAFTKYPLTLAASLLVLLLIGYGIFEITAHRSATDEEALTQIIDQSLDDAINLFHRMYNELDESSAEIRDLVEQAAETGQGRMAIYNRFVQNNLWGITIYKNDIPWLWKGFDLNQPPPLSDSEAASARTTIASYNNVIVLLNQQQLEVEDDLFNILTAKRLVQTTDLPFIKNIEYQLSNEPELRHNYPVQFSFFGTLPGNSFHRTLSTPEADSVGTVYASLDRSNSFLRNQNEIHYRWRFAFHVAMFLSFFLLLVVWSTIKKSVSMQILQMLLIFMLWPLILLSGWVYYWVTLFISAGAEADPHTIYLLAEYITNATFLFLIFVSFYNLLRFSPPPNRDEKHFRSLAFAALFGALCLMLLLFFVFSTKTVLTESSIPLLDLELAPDIESFIFYIFSGIFLTATSGIILSAGYFLLVSEEGKTALISLVASCSFILLYFIIDLFIDENLFLSWVFSITVSLFLLYLFICYKLYKYPDRWYNMSGFRKLMIGVFVISISVYFIVWNTSKNWMDQDLLEQVNLYTDEDALNTRDVLFELLSDIEADLSQLTEADFSEQPQVVQSYFQRSVQGSIRAEWKNHSFHIRLVTPPGDEIANYSTTLETPAWSRVFSTDTMLRSYRGEQIRWQTNRPVIWGRPAVSDRYTTLERGWIPLYDAEQPGLMIAWITGDVFKERLDYNKPMRAVLSAATKSDWKQSYYIAEYLGERLTGSTVRGIYLNQPQYNKLPQREAEIARQDSISFITNITSDGSFREVLVKHDERTIIKASTPIPGFNHHLFSFFRMQIVMIFFGLFCFSLLAMAGFQPFSLFGQNRRFKDRLVDGLTLATILFLIVLIFATQYAVDIQNEKNVEREVVNSLSSVAEALKDRDLFSEGADPAELLSEITTPLNVDLILYHGSSVAVSTTPQIFQQHLVPATIPYPVFDFLYNRERTHYIASSEIGTDQMLIGYRSLANSEGEPVGAIAIPTFLQSPVYNEQLLETTSYLFVVYLFIFTLFILGSVVLSNQLTKPLKLIQVGLNKISRGDMKTKVAVTSQDEIGSLADAYNTMVQRLDHAQKELMKAERESAWKEMAQQVAHEIKNPLTPMKLNLQHLQRQLDNNPERTQDLKPVIEKTATNIIEQIESLNKIASDFSKFAKPIEEPKEQIDLTLLVKSVVDLYEHDDSAEIRYTCPKQKVEVFGVEDELRRSFINLIKNAIEACSPEKAEIWVTLKKMREHAMIQIKDNGLGIDEADRDKIFLPKFSTKSSGTGLGLAITKKIVEAHDADIWFDSKKGQGTSFFIRIPTL